MSTTDKMKSGASNFFSKTKTEIARAKQKVLVKTGHAEETVDVSFNAEVQRFTDNYETFKKISKDAQKLLDVLKDLATVQASLAEDFYELYEQKGELYNACLRHQDTTKTIDAARVQFDEQLRANFIEPISKHLGQYKDIKGRLEELNTRRVDMDRYGRDVRSANEKGKSTVAHKEQKFDTAKMNYQNLHDELMHDLPALHDDRIPFFDPAFATYVMHLHEFYKNTTTTIEDVTPMVKHVNRNHLGDHPRVTTTPESSYSSHKGSGSGGSAQPGNSNPYVSGTTSTPAYNPASMSSTSSTTSSSSSSMSSTTSDPSSSVGKALPTKPMISPRVVKAQAQFDFAAQESNELSFKNGDIIIIHKQNGEWWEGELNGKKGLLPSNYVQLLS